MLISKFSVLMGTCGFYLLANAGQDVMGKEKLCRTRSKPGLSVSSASTCCVAPRMALGFLICDVRTGTASLLRLWKALLEPLTATV